MIVTVPLSRFEQASSVPSREMSSRLLLSPPRAIAETKHSAKQIHVVRMVPLTENEKGPPRDLAGRAGSCAQLGVTQNSLEDLRCVGENRLGAFLVQRTL